MNYQEFRNKLFELECFNTNQVYAWKPDFEKNNLWEWVRKGLLVKLRNSYYTFPEFKNKSGFSFFLANRIYRPSYISLHTVLAFYGIIPEAVVLITSVTSLKTAGFSNEFGEFSYKSIRSDLFFGYELKPLDGRSLLFATPEKALLDLIYLSPFYKTEVDFQELRLDEDYMQNNLNVSLFQEYLKQFGSKTLEKRANLLLKTYQL
jgi:predicted transcriptional regulator of viral defense system